MTSFDDLKNDLHVRETASFSPRASVARDTKLPYALGSRTPSTLGRFRVDKLLGRGGFGNVYQAFDTDLERTVAIKLIFREAMSPWNEVDFFKEARILASLDHPHIVPIYEVGMSAEGDHFLVSKLIDGCDLSTRIKKEPLECKLALEIVEIIANALHYAHTKGLIHRDVKPANILLDRSGTPYLADFGIALREIDLGGHVLNGGTPAYMSPEQARAESHRVDHRSDIYSLGVVLFELLTGRRPFHSEDTMKLLSRIASEDVRTPRIFDHSIPSDLERICLRALSRRATDRYQVAKDLADEVRWSLDNWTAFGEASDRSCVSTASPLASARLSSSERARGKNYEPRMVQVSVVPKGLRSFDAMDSDFFLDLLPGPRDRDNLPDSIRFWKSRTEEVNPERCFSVGLIYGPSGCGKSSLIKAGLLPRLCSRIQTIYVESSAKDSELRLIRGVKNAIPQAKGETLFELLATIRRQRLIPKGGKLLLVLDQFEQWLHSESDYARAPLTEALRQCDGVHIQAIVMVRDDFWLSVSRFLREIEVPIREGENSGLVDLFELDHATKVLTLFGKAFGKFPDTWSEFTEDQKAFLSQAINCLSQRGKVVPVRLAVFAEMMKSRSWTTDGLKEVGGIDGIGVTFLEETFGSHAPPEFRPHRESARRLLKALLPSAGTDIKGNMRTRSELQAASGYENKPREFDELIQLLDRCLRLITPVDNYLLPVTATISDIDHKTDLQSLNRQVPMVIREFQLTHDYMVPSLRDWLTRKQKETRKGRAELMLADRSSIWKTRPENRYLPSLTEWFFILALTDRKNWNVPQQVVMHRATIFHAFQIGIALTLLMAVASVGIAARWQVLLRQEATRIEGLVGQLRSAEPSKVPEIIKQLDGNHEVATAFLSPIVSKDAKTPDDKRSQLHARLALVSRDKSLVEPLVEELLANKVAYIAPICQQLRPYAGVLNEKLCAILRDENAQDNRRFRAALALANFALEIETATWTAADLQFVAGQLVKANSEFQSQLRDNLRPISKQLLPDLEKKFADEKSSDAQRLNATNALADFASGDIPKLSNLLTLAIPEQYTILYPIVAANSTISTVEELSKIAATLPAAKMGSAERIAYGQQRANAAVTLLRLGEREKVTPVFDMTDDPEALTQFIFRCRDRGVRIEDLLDLHQLITRSESSVPQQRGRELYAVLLALGEYSFSEIPESRRENLLQKLASTYRIDPSSGIHGAAGWLLRHWGQAEVVQNVDQTAVPYSNDREWFTLAITVAPKSPVEPTKKETEGKQDKATNVEQSTEGDGTIKEDVKGAELKPLPQKTFYYTFVVFPAGESKVGSVNDESDRQKNEVLHSVTLTRPFALLDREITMEELIAYDPDYAHFMEQFDAKPSDAGFAADWYDSVAFCRWLGMQSGIAEGDQSYAAPELLSKEDYPRETHPWADWAPRNWPMRLDRPSFRLPTESEWEVASRVTARTAYGFGSESSLLGCFGWFQDNSSKHVHPPRELRPNLRGLFDMHGNLLEWSHDWFAEYEVTAVVDPMVSTKGAYRVSRGGGWYSNAANCRATIRSSYAPSNHMSNVGFRIALSLSVESPEVDTECK